MTNNERIGKKIKQEFIDKFSDNIIKEVDGYYCLLLNNLEGELGSYELRLIADHIDELNSDWHDKVRTDLQDMNE